MHRILPVVLLATACESRLTGNLGNFEFSYPTDDDVVNFNKPIAVGASLDVGVHDVDNKQPVALTMAETDDSTVLSVVDFSGNTVTLQGESDGSALLQVEGETSDGELQNDEVNMLARTAEVMELWHSCTKQDGSAAYLLNQRVWMPFELEAENGQPTIGYGFYPLTVDGGSATLNKADSNQTWMAFDTASDPGVVELSSDIDDAALTLEMVAATDIDGVSEPIAWVIEDINVGDVNGFYVHPTVGDLTVCQADTTKTVQSLTPEICDVRDRNADDEDLHEFGWFEVEGIKVGTCEYQVTFTASGASGTFTYPIE